MAGLALTVTAFLSTETTFYNALTTGLTAATGAGLEVALGNSFGASFDTGSAVFPTAGGCFLSICAKEAFSNNTQSRRRTNYKGHER